MLKNFSSLQAEYEVIGRILLEPKLLYQVNGLVKADDFSDQKNKAVFKAMVECDKEGKPLEPGMLVQFLKSSDVGVSDLMGISSKVASTSDIVHYTEILIENSKKRKLFEVIKKSQDRLAAESFSDIAQWLSSELYRIDEAKQSGACVDREQLMEEVLNYLQRGIETKGESIGMKTGWPSLDAALTGFKRGDLVILGARPAMGKTAFALNVTDRLSKSYKILFFEMEMKALKLGMREVAAKSYLPMNKLFSPHTLTEAELRSVMDAVSKIAHKGNVVFDDRGRPPLEYVRNQVRNIKHSIGVDIVIVDHIGLIKETKNYSNRNEWLGEVSSSLKAIAKEFDVCVIALSQLSRGVEHRTGNKPQLSDLRESGNIEQDADVVMMLYRAGYYNKDIAPENEALEVLIEKNRDGKTGTVNMAINLKKQLVTELYK